ncbi:MAG: WYL domain-containing protein [Smithella sp.]
MRVAEYDSIRTLAMERINKINITEKEFDAPADFDPDVILEDAFGIVYDDPVTVKIQFCPKQSPYIQERQWCKNQNIEKLKDGSIILTMNRTIAFPWRNSWCSIWKR